jgi:AcrR family transcriptional regulator
MTDDPPPGDDRDTHEVLMDATYRTLASAGYDDLSLRAVADEAGKSRGLVHYHFESKDDLVLSLLDYLLAGLEADLAGAVPGEGGTDEEGPGEGVSNDEGPVEETGDEETGDVGTVEGDPRAALRHLLDRIGYGPRDRDPDAYYRALYAIRSRAPFDDEIRARLTRNYRHLVEQCASIIEVGIDAGDFRAVDPDATARFLVVAVDGARNTELSLDTDRTREAVFDLLEDLVFPALCRPS